MILSDQFPRSSLAKSSQVGTGIFNEDSPADTKEVEKVIAKKQNSLNKTAFL
jgi:hypothetical protein